MQLFYEIFPVFLFFLAFKFYDIYVATVVGIVTTCIQVLASRAMTGKWDRKQLVTLAIFLFFGGMTLYFHDPIFVKWKPTIVFWIFGCIIIGYQLFTRRSLTQHLMSNMLQDQGSVPVNIWKKLDWMWIIFFAALGGINLYIAYFFSNDAWVNFKFYGVTAALFFFSILQAVYLVRYLPQSKSK